jgi:threonine/homoserine/homoserine lactone efflux protein
MLPLQNAKFIPLFEQDGTYFFISRTVGSVYLLYLQVKRLQAMGNKFRKQGDFGTRFEISIKIYGLVLSAKGK